MTDVTPDWEARVAEVFTAIDSYDEGELVARIDALVSELAPGSAIGLFERGAACDSTGHPDRAVPLYRAALDAGLVGERRRRAVIQLAIAIALIMVAVVFLLIAVIEALNAMPSGLGILGSEWVRWLALGGIFLIFAAVFIFIGQSRARKAIKRGRKQVQDTLKEDAEWLRELTKRSVKGS